MSVLTLPTGPFPHHHFTCEGPAPQKILAYCGFGWRYHPEDWALYRWDAMDWTQSTTEHAYQYGGLTQKDPPACFFEVHFIYSDTRTVFTCPDSLPTTSSNSG